MCLGQASGLAGSWSQRCPGSSCIVGKYKYRRGTWSLAAWARHRRSIAQCFLFHPLLWEADSCTFSVPFQLKHPSTPIPGSLQSHFKAIGKTLLPLRRRFLFCLFTHLSVLFCSGLHWLLIECSYHSATISWAMLSERHH